MTARHRALPETVACGTFIEALGRLQHWAPARYNTRTHAGTEREAKYYLLDACKVNIETFCTVGAIIPGADMAHTGGDLATDEVDALVHVLVLAPCCCLCDSGGGAAAATEISLRVEGCTAARAHPIALRRHGPRGSIPLASCRVAAVLAAVIQRT